jgi:SRSO17 transposase
VAVEDRVNPVLWQSILDDGLARIAGRFVRVEPRSTAKALVSGLLSGIGRKNCWWLAEHAGHESPDRMQRLLRKARWDADGVRDDVRGFVAEHLGHPGGVLIVDETGFLKKGTSSVGVQRQYTGTAGRVENAQVAVFLAYAGPFGHALIDRRLYLPQKSWCADSQRCTAAGVPADTVFTTKPMLAKQAIIDALDAGIAAQWVTGDEVYGGDPRLRDALRDKRIGYVLAVACDHRIPAYNTSTRVDVIAAGVPAQSWQVLSAGAGAKGPRLYAWAWITITDTDEHRWLLIRRNMTTGELAFYRCGSPARTTLAELVRVAGTRWTVEECFQAAKDQIGLDQYQVRGWTGWHRFITLAMLALAVLTVMAAQSRPATPIDPLTDTHIALTVAEVRRLFNIIVTGDAAKALRVSLWRRKVQATARRSHYQRRLAAG